MSQNLANGQSPNYPGGPSPQMNSANQIDIGLSHYAQNFIGIDSGSFGVATLMGGQATHLGIPRLQSVAEMRNYDRLYNQQYHMQVPGGVQPPGSMGNFGMHNLAGAPQMSYDAPRYEDPYLQQVNFFEANMANNIHYQPRQSYYDFPQIPVSPRNNYGGFHPYNHMDMTQGGLLDNTLQSPYANPIYEPGI